MNDCGINDSWDLYETFNLIRIKSDSSINTWIFVIIIAFSAPTDISLNISYRKLKNKSASAFNQHWVFFTIFPAGNNISLEISSLYITLHRWLHTTFKAISNGLHLAGLYRLVSSHEQRLVDENVISNHSWNNIWILSLCSKKNYVRTLFQWNWGIFTINNIIFSRQSAQKILH